MNKLVKSLITLCLISTCTALCFSTSIVSFAKVFVVSTIIQVVSYNIYQQVVYFIGQKLLNDRISEYSKQGLEVVCPCSRAVRSFIPIQLDTDNSYKCLECTKNVAVNIEVKTFLETQPVDLEKSNDALNKVYNTVSQDGV